MNSKFIQLFQRNTSSANFIPEIDGLRFFAIMTVVVFHFHFLLAKELASEVSIHLPYEGFWQLGWWLVRLDLGVKVFFGISGFILSVPFLNQYWFGGKKIQLKNYFWRRITRLEPPFIIALSALFLVHLFINGESFKELFPNFLASIFYVHEIIFNEYSLINPVTWSLETEVQFYIIIPFLAFISLGNKNKVIGFLILLILFVVSLFFKSFVLTNHPYGLGTNILVFLSHFLIGTFFAILFLSRKDWVMKKIILFDLIGLLSFFGLFWFYKPQANAFNNFMFNVSLFWMFISVFKGQAINNIFRTPFLYLIGGMCYTIYLLHLAYFYLFVKVAKSILISENYLVNLLFQFSLASIGLMLISSFFYLVIEKPCMDKDWPKKLGKKLGLMNK
ncbi:acyltransferase [Algoriphagus aestuarii]|nr:acyltransferase [Algoriphagus aestuarii]